VQGSTRCDWFSTNWHHRALACFTSRLGTCFKKVLKRTDRLSQRLYGFTIHLEVRNLTNPIGRLNVCVRIKKFLAYEKYFKYLLGISSDDRIPTIALVTIFVMRTGFSWVSRRDSGVKPRWPLGGCNSSRAKGSIPFRTISIHSGIDGKDGQDGPSGSLGQSDDFSGFTASRWLRCTALSQVPVQSLPTVRNCRQAS